MQGIFTILFYQLITRITLDFGYFNSIASSYLHLLLFLYSSLISSSLIYIIL